MAQDIAQGRLERAVCGQRVVLQVPENGDLRAVGADHFDALTIDVRLHSQHGVIVQYVFQPAPDQPIAGKGTVGYASVDHHDLDSTGAAFSQEVRPDFSFRNDDQFRIQPVQYSTDSARKIKREVENVVGYSKSVACQLLSG